MAELVFYFGFENPEEQFKKTPCLLYFVKLFKIQLSDARQWYPSEFRTPSKKFKSQSDQKHSPPWKHDGPLCTYLKEEV